MQWKIIDGFTNYKVSKDGMVLSIKRNKELRQYENKGYLGVYLYGKSGRKFKLVHRLVAEAFIPNPNDYPQINHIDEDSQNNKAENLEWCTAKYNANYGSHPQKMREKMRENNPFRGKSHTEESKQKMRQAKLGKPSKRKRAIVIDDKEFDSVSAAMYELGVGTRKIYSLIKESEK